MNCFHIAYFPQSRKSVPLRSIKLKLPMKKIILLSAVLIVSLISLQGQDRYGHLNLGNLIAQMPEAVAANDSLEIMQATMVATGETMAQQFQRDATAFVKAVQGGGMRV